MQNGSLKLTTNRQDWSSTGEMRDQSNALIDLTGWGFVIALYDRETGRQRIVASTDNGLITITGPGTFRWNVPEASMHGLCPETYNVGIQYRTPSGVKKNFFEGTIIVLQGHVP